MIPPPPPPTTQRLNQPDSPSYPQSASSRTETSGGASSSPPRSPSPGPSTPWTSPPSVRACFWLLWGLLGVDRGVHMYVSIHMDRPWSASACRHSFMDGKTTPPRGLPALRPACVCASSRSHSPTHIHTPTHHIINPLTYTAPYDALVTASARLALVSGRTNQVAKSFSRWVRQDRKRTNKIKKTHTHTHV